MVACIVETRVDLKYVIDVVKNAFSITCDFIFCYFL